jgi:hypothetical protein
VESDTSVQTRDDEGDLRSSASLAPPSSTHTEVTFKSIANFGNGFNCGPNF